VLGSALVCAAGQVVGCAPRRVGNGNGPIPASLSRFRLLPNQGSPEMLPLVAPSWADPKLRAPPRQSVVSGFGSQAPHNGRMGRGG
jgi:hypothetical protein